MTGTPISLRELGLRAQPRPGLLADAHGRVKKKLRLSVTDRCNFRCHYCLPETPQWLPRSELLSVREVAALTRLFVTELGITSLRLTGGEPLLRRDLPQIVAALDTLRPQGLERISLTTNGTLLARRAAALRESGLDDLNVSLDARTPAVFERLTGGKLAPVLRGIDAARAAGLAVKLNTVVVRGHNDGEIVPLARWALAEGLELRFIEFMPLDGGDAWTLDKVVPEREILAALAAGGVDLDARPRDTSPATPYASATGGSLGVISTVSNPFCASCDRVRVTATGELYTCLFAREGAALAPALRAGDDAGLLAAVRAAVWRKDAGYAARPGYAQRAVSMHQLGG